MIRWLILFFLSLLALAGATYIYAGRGAPPLLTVQRPDRFVGHTGTLEIVAESPDAKITSLTIALEQNGRITQLFTLDNPQGATVTEPDVHHLRVSRPFGKQSVPELQAGPARLVVSATRPSFLRLRTLSSSTSKTFQVRLEPPRVAVVSTHHYVNHGGAEMVVYRATPPDVQSGVRVGDLEYPGYAVSSSQETTSSANPQRSQTPGEAAGQSASVGSDQTLKLAFFALLHDQPLKTPISLYARDEAGNEAHASFVDNVFEKPFKKSRLELDDRFLNRVVPEILQHAPELKVAPPVEGEDMLPAFLKINGELRRLNNDTIAAISSKTAPVRLWHGPFVQLGNSQVEASFADHRTYLYKGKEVDHQVHLGFDLAVTANVPVVAANDGRVLHAGWLGIFGNCMIIDHGMGVQSLYGHLSAFDVNVGDAVQKGKTIGRSGMTGLAGGDHLHFTMLVQGRPVNPVEWWDPHWVQDRVDRKLER